MDLILVWLWLLRVATELKRCREEIRLSWTQLLETLFLRREIMPYLVTSISCREPEMVQTIGNACDLAVSSTKISDQGRAEQRLGAALERLLAAVEKNPDVTSDPNFKRLTGELKMLGTRIEFLAGTYNKQAIAYNIRLAGPSAKVLGLFVDIARAELFPIVTGNEKNDVSATGG